jgi:hypothetical protein
MQNNEEATDINLTPEQVLQDFILRHRGENRHTRRMAGKMIGFKITGTNVPYKKDEKK